LVYISKKAPHYLQMSASLIIFRESFALYSENQMKPVTRDSGCHTDLLYITAGDTYRNQFPIN